MKRLFVWISLALLIGVLPQHAYAVQNTARVFMPPFDRVAPGNVINIPVQIENSDQLAGLTLNIRYDASMMGEPEIERTNLPESATMVVNRQADGLLTIGIMSPEPLNFNGEALTLVFNSAYQATGGAQIRLAASACNVTGHPVGIQVNGTTINFFSEDSEAADFSSEDSETADFQEGRDRGAIKGGDHPLRSPSSQSVPAGARSKSKEFRSDKLEKQGIFLGKYEGIESEEELLRSITIPGGDRETMSYTGGHVHGSVASGNKFEYSLSLVDNECGLQLIQLNIEFVDSVRNPSYAILDGTMFRVIKKGEKEVCYQIIPAGLNGGVWFYLFLADSIHPIELYVRR